MSEFEQDSRLVTFTASNGDEVVIDEYNDCITAYYCREDGITGYVWLFNVGETPEAEPWTAPDAEPPFQNSTAYCHAHLIEGPIQSTDFDAAFNDERQTVGIYFRKKLIGVLWSDAKPGKSAYASVDSPVALVLKT